MSTLDFDRDGPLWPTAPYGRFETIDGFRWFVAERGQGPLVLALHGAGGSTHGWGPLIERLHESFRIVAIDLPGHGFSDTPPDGDLSRPAMSRAVGRLLRHLRISPSRVVAHSAGTGLALQMALDGQLEDATIVGVAPSIVRPRRMPNPSPFSDAARRFMPVGAIASVMAGIARADRFVDQVLSSTGSRLPEAQKACYRRIAASSAKVEGAIRMMADWEPEALVARLPEVPARVRSVRLVAGRRDGWIALQEVEEAAAWMNAVCPPPTVIDAGHLAAEEAPEVVAAIVREALVG